MDQYKRTVAPTTEPITLDEAKAHCAISGTDDYDEYLAALIGRATEAIEKRLGRQIMPATWTLTLESFPAEIFITKPPVTSVSSIAYLDSAGVSQTLAASKYQVDVSTQDGPARIMPAYGLTWPDTRPDVYGAVIVTFVAGYATASVVPLSLKHAIAFLVAHWFKSREPVTAETVNSLPSGLDMLLSLEDWGTYA